MILADMIAADEDALICDFAETYHVYDYRRLPLRYAATLASGLRANSRIKMKKAGLRMPMDTLLNAAAVDALNFLVWSKSKDGAKGRNRPASIFAKLMNDEKNDVMAFDSGAAFEAARERILNGGKDRNC